MPTVICLFGPTAVGKTDLACALADQWPVQLISVDASLVYRELNIASAKPDPITLQRYPHALINIRSINQTYCAADFYQDAKQAITEALNHQKIPLLVGGTMLYFKALQQGLSKLPVANPEIRNRILYQAQAKGWETLHQQLAQVDPQAANRIHPNDPQRLQRALEIYHLTGKTQTQLWQQHKPTALPYQWLNIALIPHNRQQLTPRIEQRFDAMLTKGLLDEVKQLQQRFPNFANLPALKAVGYRQALAHLCGEYDIDEFRQRAIIATRQLAKRQLTWIRTWPQTQSFYCGQDRQPLLQQLTEHLRDCLLTDLKSV